MNPAAQPPPEQPPGPGVDLYGRPVVDPTANVLKLVEEAVKRLDDLRHADERRLDDLLAASMARMGEMLDTKVEYLEKMNGQRDLHAMELREAESARIDAIRQIDVGAVQQAGSVAATQASTLAAQVATSAETLRTQVAAAASAATIALSAALEPVQKDIADLRRAQYEQQGAKINVVEGHARGANNGLWIGLAVAVVALVLTFILGGIGIAMTLLLRGH